MKDIFDYTSMYTYNDDCMCYENVKMLVDVGSLKKGTCIDEVLLNLRTMRMKFNLGDKILSVEFDVVLNNHTVIVNEGCDSGFEDDSLNI